MSRSADKPFGFETTQWSLVLAAGEQVGISRNDLLAELCQRYWRPLYGFARRNGLTPHAAEDAVQAFFAHLLSGDGLKQADQNRGRFRTFLLTSLKNFLHNQPATTTSPEAEFERRWALTVLAAARNGRFRPANGIARRVRCVWPCIRRRRKSFLRNSI